MTVRDGTHQESPLKVNLCRACMVHVSENSSKAEVLTCTCTKSEKEQSQTEFVVNLNKIFLKKLQFLNIFGKCHVRGRDSTHREGPLKVILRRACVVHVWEYSSKAKLITFTCTKSEKSQSQTEFVVDSHKIILKKVTIFEYIWQISCKGKRQ